MTQLPAWAQALQLAATIAVAVFAALIACRQWQTAHQRVVLDLFERRMGVYEEARSVISEILRNGAATNANFSPYVRATDRLPMSFGDDVVACSDKIRKCINDLHYYGTQGAAGAQKVTDTSNELMKRYEEFSTLVLPYVRMKQKL